MNEQPGRGSSHRRSPRHAYDQGKDQPEGEGLADLTTSLKGIHALERLRDRILTVANEILRLREENAALAERIARLEARPESLFEEGTLLHLEEDPEALRRKITGFIEAIDQYLEREQAPNP